jgi:ABC-type Mn2+/Zn2+ transport system ATPase subunit
MLEVRELNVMRGRLQVIWDASINVRDGEIVALIGSNGAGKSTLLSTIAGLLKPFSGTILFQGKKKSLGYRLIGLWIWGFLLYLKIESCLLTARSAKT